MRLNFTLQEQTNIVCRALPGVKSFEDLGLKKDTMKEAHHLCVITWLYLSCSTWFCSQEMQLMCFDEQVRMKLNHNHLVWVDIKATTHSAACVLSYPLNHANICVTLLYAQNIFLKQVTNMWEKWILTQKQILEKSGGVSESEFTSYQSTFLIV